MQLPKLNAKWLSPRRWFGQSDAADDSEQSTKPGLALMKSAPPRLSLNYRVMSDQKNIDALFLRLRDELYQLIEQDRRRRGASRFIRESGRLPPQRPYFYLKPLNQPGWLFERSGQGWTIAPAEKIVNQGTFVRGLDVWDQVVLHESDSGAALPRVTSPRLGAEMVTFGIYRDLLVGSLGLSDLADQAESR